MADKLPVKEFSAKIKAKYPQYKDVDDNELARRIVEKYPAYKDQVSFEEAMPLKKKDDLLSPRVSPSGAEAFGLPSYTSPQNNVPKADPVPEEQPVKDFPVNLQLGNQRGGLGSSLTDVPTWGQAADNARYGNPADNLAAQKLQGHLDVYANAQGIDVNDLPVGPPQRSIGGEGLEIPSGGGGTALKKGTFSASASFYEIPRLIYDFTGMGGVLPYDEFLSNVPMDNPLVTLNRLAMTQQGTANQYGKKMRQYEFGIAESLGHGDFAAAGNQIWNSIAESVPSIAMMYLGGGAGQAMKLGQAGRQLVMAAPFAAAKNRELTTNPDVPEYLKPTLSVMHGLSETVFEQAFGTKAQIDNLIRTIATGGREAGMRQVRQTLGTFIDKSLNTAGPFKSVFTGAGSEMLTSLSQNMLDKYSGADPDRDLMEGVADAGIVGAAMDSSISGLRTGFKNTAVAIRDKKARAEVERLTESNKGLINDIENLELTPEQRSGVFGMLETNNKKIADYLDAERATRNKLSFRQRIIEEKLLERSEEIERLKETEGLSDTTLEALEAEQAEIVTQLDELVESDPAKAPNPSELPSIDNLPPAVLSEVEPLTERYIELRATINEPRFSETERGLMRIEMNDTMTRINQLVDGAQNSPAEPVSPVADVNVSEAVESPVQEAVEAQDVIDSPVSEIENVQTNQEETEGVQDTEVAAEIVEPVINQEGGQDAIQVSSPEEISMGEPSGNSETVGEGVSQEAETIVSQEAESGPKEKVAKPKRPKKRSVVDIKKLGNKIASTRRRAKQLEEESPEEIMDAKIRDRQKTPADKAVYQERIDKARTERQAKLKETRAELRLLQLEKAGLSPQAEINIPDTDTRERQLAEMEPEKLAEAYNEEVINPTHLTEDERAIYNYGGFGVTRSSFINNQSKDDAAGLGEWIGADDGLTIDQVAKAIDDEYSDGSGVIGPEDVAKFMMRFPGGHESVTRPSGNPNLALINDIYYQKTGQRLNRRSAKEIAARHNIPEPVATEVSQTDRMDSLVAEAWDAIPSPFDAEAIDRVPDTGKLIESFDRVEGLLEYLGKTPEEIQALKDYLEYEQAQASDQATAESEINFDQQIEAPTRRKAASPRPAPRVESESAVVEEAAKVTPKNLVEKLLDADYRQTRAEELRARIQAHRASANNLGIMKDPEAEARYWRDITDYAVIQIIDGVINTSRDLAELLGIPNGKKLKDAFISAQAIVDADNILAKTSARNADTRGKRIAYGFEERIPLVTQSQITVIEEAKRLLADKYDVYALMGRVEGGVTALETAILAQFAAAKEAELIEMNTSLETKLRDASASLFESEVAKRDQIMVDMIAAYDAMELAGTVNAQALSIRKAFVQRDLSLARMLIDRRKSVGNAVLSPGQIAQVQQNFSDLEKAFAKQKEALEKAESEAARLEIENEVLREAKVTRSVGRRTIKADTRDAREVKKEKHLKNIQSIKDRLRAITRESRAELSSTPFKPEVIVLLGKLAKEHVELGIIEAEALVEAVYNDVRDMIDGVSKRDVRDALSGYSRTTDTRPTRSVLQNKLYDIRRELKLISAIEDAEAKVKKSKNPVDKESDSIKVKELKERLKAVRAENNRKTDAELLEQEKARVASRIAKVQQQILDNDFNDPEASKKPRLTDPELEALKERERRLIEQKNKLDTQRQNKLSQRQRDNYKKHLADDIADLEKQIAARRKDRKDRKLKYENDPEIVELRRIKQEKTDLINSIDPSALEESRDRAKLKALEKSIKDLQERLDKNKLVPEDTTTRPDTPEMKRLKAERDKLSKELETRRKEALEAGDAEVTAAELKALVASAESRLKNIQLAIQEGRYRQTIKKTKPTSPELEAANKEIRRVRREFLLENARQELRRRGNMKQFMDAVIEVSALPRQVMSTADLSAILRQGAFALSRPVTAFSAFKLGLKFWWSQDAYDEWMQEIENSPGYELIQASGLDITTTLQTPDIQAREELFQSRLLNMIPVLGETRKIGGVNVRGVNIFAKSERNYTGTLNKLRVDLFTKGVELLQLQGRSYENSPDSYKALADYVNIATGRGKLDGKMKTAAPFLSSVLFAPRFLMSRIQFLSGYPLLMKGSNILSKSDTNVVAKMYARDLMGFYAYGMTMIYLAKMMAGVIGFFGDEEDSIVDVEDSPFSTDFGKIRVGDTRIDMWAGAQQLMVLAARMAPQFMGGGKYTSIAGNTTIVGDPDDPNARTRDEIAIRFVRSKASPLVGYAWSAMSGTNYMGERFDAIPELGQILFPMGPMGIIENYQDLESKSFATLLAAGTILGASIQTYRVNNFLEKGVDDKSIQLLTKNKAMVQDPGVKHKNIFDKNGDRRSMTSSEYQKYSDVYLDYVRVQLEGQSEELKQLGKKDFQGRLNAIKGQATMAAEDAVSGVTKAMTRVNINGKKMILTGDQIKIRLQIKNKFLAENRDLLKETYDAYVENGYSKDAAKLEANKAMRKSAEDYSAAIIGEMHVEGKIKLREDPENEN